MPDFNKKLHIVAFDIPWPPDYGGAIDVFYKIKSLAEAGITIYLHCYEYGRKHAATLEDMCEKVCYYPRATGWKGLSLGLPYIVNSRRSSDLLKNLREIDAPVLFEGVHTTYYLNDPSLKDRFKIIRTHNIEHDYYKQLTRGDTNLVRRLFHTVEAFHLKRYEKRLDSAQAFFSLSIADSSYFKRAYPEAINAYIPPFHPYDHISIVPGSGSYCLYHGNLSHNENEQAALFLLKEVIPLVKVPFIIAGMNPTRLVKELAAKYVHCQLIPNPSLNQMNDLMRDAHIHVLPTFQTSGMKLKLLNALFSGRHVLVNDDMIYGANGLKSVCNVAENAGAFIIKIAELMIVPFTSTDIGLRYVLLMNEYNNGENANRIITYLPPISH